MTRPPPADDPRLPYSVACALVQAYAAGDGCANVLRLVGEGDGWDAAVLWSIDGETATVTDGWLADPAQASRLSGLTVGRVLQRGLGFTGRAWARREIHWIDDVQAEPAFAHAGMRTGCFVPLLGSGVVGVLELLESGKTVVKAEALSSLATLAPQLGRFLFRKHHDAEQLARLERSQRVLASRLNSVSEDEKTRLAREIHDVLGQELTNLKLDAAWISRRITEVAGSERDLIAPRLQAMSRQIDGCVNTVRRIATGLRPSVLDDLGLVDAIDWQIRDFQGRTEAVVEVSLPEEELVVDGERTTGLFRILQELLTNISRHAEASTVRVALRHEAASLVMEVRDDGRGVTEEEASRSTSLGILGMRERAELLGGSLAIHGRPGLGTLVTVRIPMSLQ